MDPYFVINNLPNQDLAYRELFSNFLLCHFIFFIKVSYFYDIGIFKFGIYVFSSASIAYCFTAARTSFRVTISKIIKLGTKPQVFWVYAWRIITFMKNKHSFWNWAISQLPTKSMGTDVSPLIIKIFNRKPTIALFHSGGLPFPAAASFFNLIPKPFHSDRYAIAGTVAQEGVF